MENYAIEMLNITKTFSGKAANDNISIQLKKGEIHALLGENGAGKSTLMSILFGLYQADSGIIKKDGEVIDLTPSEYSILTTLCQNVGRPYSRLQLLNATLGESYAGYERAIDTHVSNLRKKIEPNPQKPVYILTVYGLGYKFGDNYETNQ